MRCTKLSIIPSYYLSIKFTVLIKFVTPNHPGSCMFGDSHINNDDLSQLKCDSNYSRLLEPFEWTIHYSNGFHND